MHSNIVTINKLVVVKSVMKTAVIMVIRIEQFKLLARGMERGMTIEHVKCRADLNFEVDFEVNMGIGTIMIKCDLILFR